MIDVCMPFFISAICFIIISYFKIPYDAAQYLVRNKCLYLYSTTRYRQKQGRHNRVNEN